MMTIDTTDSIELKQKTTLSFQSIVLFTFIRTVINASYRLVYPLLPLFAAGMGVGLEQMGMAFSIRSVLGVISPFLAAMADTRGRKHAMLLGLVFFFLASLIPAIWPVFLGFVIGSGLLVIGNGIFIPSMQSYISDRVPYKQRGKILSITELSWSLGFILGVPTLGFLVQRFHWSTPSILLTVLSVLMLTALWFLVTEDYPTQEANVSILANMGKTLIYLPVLGGILASLLFTTANEIVNMVFGEWIKDSFGLAFATLTIASVVIGASEFSSEFLSALFLDKAGKERTLIFSLVFNALILIVLPLGKNSLVLALILLAFFYISFEFALIAIITLMSEMMPQFRATVMAIVIAIISLGRMLGNLIGPGLYQKGFWYSCLSAAGLNLISILCLKMLECKRSKASN